MSKNAKIIAWVLGVLLLIGLGYFAYSYERQTIDGPSYLPESDFPMPSTSPAEPPVEAIPASESMVRISSIEIPVELARTPEEVRQGLSGRPSLPAGEGMLFMFAEPDFYRFWMPDMNFPLDIIWINADKVVDISHNVSNEFDPANPRFYIPSEPAQYVLEVNAGFATRKGLSIGDAVVFSNVL
jgi:uncharacterized membrane protein (UPF0127 family)